MNEQIGHPYRRTRDGKQVKERRTSSQNYQQSSNPHRVGHSSGLHPEDQPYVSEDLEEDDRYYETRLPTSTRRYNLSPHEQVFQQGNKRIIVHYEEPPPMHRRKSRGENKEKPQPRFHPLLVVGLFLMLLFGGLIGLTALGSWWQTKQDDWTYGQNPRTFQTDVNVGHGTAQNPLSHFLALNLRGQIEVIELPGFDVSKAKSYEITVIPANQGNPPVKLVFQDLNRDGKLDMLVEIGEPGSYITIMLFNNGTQFVSKL
jgi:hypothetical protein